MFNKNTYKRLHSYLIGRLGMHEYRNGWLKGDCPECNKADKFGVNLSLGKSNCFVCGYNPHPLTLVMEVERLANRTEVLKYLGNFEESDYTEPILKKLEDVNIVLPEGYKNLSLGDSALGKLARKYIKNRGFDIDEVSLKGWGYCNTGKYFGYIILPFYVDGKLVYFNARKFTGSGPKYNNPDTEETGIGKSLIIYNYNALYAYKEVYLAEGLFNAETMGDQGIATGGKKVSQHQLSSILGSPVERITLLLDPDAINESIQLAMDMSFHKKVRLVYWEGDADVNDIGYTRMMQMIENTPFQNYSGLLKLKNEINATRGIITY